MFYKKIIRRFYSNVSFLLLVFGSVSNFFLTLLIKKYFDPIDFNIYSLYLTYIGIVSVFGLIGLDQIFLRLSVVNTNTKKVSINKDVFVLIIICAFLFPVLFSLYFSNQYEYIFFYQFFLTGVGINITIFVYNIFRLTQEFSVAQVFKNGHRVLFLLVFLLLLFALNILWDITRLIDVSVLFVVLFALVGIYFIKSKIEITKSRTVNLGNFFSSYSLNLTIITLLGFGERLLILDYIGENEFGKYFYYSTIFLFPLTLIQQYVGFKELVGFKKQIDKSLLDKKIKRVIALGFLVTFGTITISLIDNGRFMEINYNSDYLLIILLSILGIVKLVYGIFSAVIGAVGTTKGIYQVNFLTLVAIGFSLLYLYLIGITLLPIVICLILVFLLRSVYIYFNYVINPTK